ncbi:MAG: 6-carboxytetrahydropterin synthase QueD, partial [Acidobacteriota bacterium]|nr:6-carboxytetrahydropterin synthase QueD [Acidobacteriota bacterium]
MRVRRQFDFEAAHRLPHHPGKCRDLHGHAYRLVVTVDRALDPSTGLAIDFGDLKKVVRGRVVEVLDHKHLNDIIANPTAENIAVWIWEQLAPSLEGLLEIELFETRQCSVVYR